MDNFYKYTHTCNIQIDVTSVYVHIKVTYMCVYLYVHMEVMCELREIVIHVSVICTCVIEVARILHVCMYICI